MRFRSLLIVFVSLGPVVFADDRSDETKAIVKNVTDDGVKEISKLESLIGLELTETWISATGLKEVADLKQLSYLMLRQTQTT